MKKFPAMMLSMLCAAALAATCVACAPAPDDQEGGEEKAKYTVTFDTDGGSAVDAQTVEEGSYATRPAEDPEKEGYVFGNWYADEGLEDGEH